MSDALFHAVMDVNVTSTFLMCRAVASGNGGAGSAATIVNMSSLAAWNGGGPGAGAYAAAKGAIVSLTKALAKELAPHGIRVNCVAPGLIGDTAFHGRFTPAGGVRERREGRPARTRRNPGGSRHRGRVPRLDRQLVPHRRDHRDQRRDEHAMKIGGLRWLMVGLIFLATVINYIDRQTVSVLKTSISHDLGLSNADYAAIQNSFLLFYGISQMVSGRLYDVIGTRLGFVFSIVLWSVAAVAHATARTAWAFGVFRAALGFGEAGNWPGAAKVVGEWFPVRERALGMGIFNTGAAVGGALSPPIIAWLATAYGWRTTFIVTGMLGFIWLALWLALFRTPGAASVDHRRGARAHPRTARPSTSAGTGVAAGLAAAARPTARRGRS